MTQEADLAVRRQLRDENLTSSEREDHAFLQELGSTRLLELSRDYERCIQLIQTALLKEEELLYGRTETPPENKVLALIGQDVAGDMRNAKHFDGTPVRTKPATFAKAPEIIEFLAAASFYLEDKGKREAALSEVADVAYNLIQLQVTDKELCQTYEVILHSIAHCLKLTPNQLATLVVAKYQCRYYQNLGKGIPEIEDARILKMSTGIRNGDSMETIFPERSDQEWKELFSRLYALVGGQVHRILVQRYKTLEQLHQIGLMLAPGMMTIAEAEDQQPDQPGL